jgi:drug/metabolite transporter (DMT)-like permease
VKRSDRTAWRGDSRITRPTADAGERVDPGRRWPIVVALLGVVVVWGVAFSGIKLLLRDVGPYSLTWARLVLAALAYTVLLPLAPRRKIRRESGDLAKLVLLGVFGAAGYHLAVNWGEQYVSAGLASLLVACMPAIVAVLAAIFLSEHLSRLGIAGLAIAFAGVGVLAVSGPGALEARNVAGVLVTLLAPISWSIYTIMSKPLAARYDGVRLNVVGAWVGALIVLPFAAADLHELTRLDLRGWLWMVYLGSFSTAGSYIVYAWALRRLPATVVASFVQLVPATSLLSAWILLDEVPAPTAFIGGALVVAGVALLQIRTRRSSSA